MRILKEIEFLNYRNLRHCRLENFADINIIIGPNNCGKTSILRGIGLLGRIRFDRFADSITCKLCEDAFGRMAGILSTQTKLEEREGLFGRPHVKVLFTFDIDEISKIANGILEKQKNILQTRSPDLDKTITAHLEKEFSKGQMDLKQKPDGNLVAEHTSFLFDKEIEASLLKNVIFCPEARLQNYRGISFSDFIEGKDFSTSEQTQIVSFLNEIVDPKITDMRQSMNFVRNFDDVNFDTGIDEQGSGVKSLICLAADILSARKNSIILLDEPELGLNPSAKHAFLRFLLEQSGKSQIFLATHDPTFVNPVLWKWYKVSLYLFSPLNDEFVKVDLNQNKEDPSTFGGYLPHTVSLKEIHIYVEGCTDVYILQEFLEKYLKANFRKFFVILNKIGIYHLGGDFWSHLLYTIPQAPYTSAIILDGDKRGIAKKVLQKIDLEGSKFVAFNSIFELQKWYFRKVTIKRQPCVLFCLDRDTIEDYLKPRPFPKEEGPEIAHDMNYVPFDIAKLFEAILWLSKVSLTKIETRDQSPERKFVDTLWNAKQIILRGLSFEAVMIVNSDAKDLVADSAKLDADSLEKINGLLNDFNKAVGKIGESGKGEEDESRRRGAVRVLDTLMDLLE